jgi:hypothetical protein
MKSAAFLASALASLLPSVTPRSENAAWPARLVSKYGCAMAAFSPAMKGCMSRRGFSFHCSSPVNMTSRSALDHATPGM